MIGVKSLLGARLCALAGGFSIPNDDVDFYKMNLILIKEFSLIQKVRIVFRMFQRSLLYHTATGTGSR